MIYIHRYELIRKQVPNSVTKNLVQEGCLIKIQDEDGFFGVADLCPWPSLGDLSLEEELSQRGFLFQRAIELATKDLTARKNKIKLITEAPIKNHILVQDYKNFDFKKVTAQFIKIKGDADITSLANLLNQISELNFKIRLDFNFCLSEEKFRYFLDLLHPNTIKKVDVIEDPFLFNQTAWAELDQKVRLALDWGFGNQNWPHRICKPSREFKDNFLYMTSAMDHPVGVAHGLSFAQKFSELTHGFLTLNTYEPTDFHSFFSQTNENLTYVSDGFGIGFTDILSKIQWEPLIAWSSDSANQILLSSKLLQFENNLLNKLSKKFSSVVNTNGYFLIASSGSTKSSHESVKLIALKKSAVINSAIRVNQQFGLTAEMNWGCVLPTHHVGGLGIIARAYKSGAKVFFNDWKSLLAADIKLWIAQNKIQLMSLVPAQIFDIIQKNIHCPPTIKFIFVGGSELSVSLSENARKLGWPIVATYGMTETASMIAFKAHGTEDFFDLMEDVQVTVENQKTFIQSNSIADYSIQMVHDEIQIKSFENKIEISDQLEIFGHKIRFLGRSDDQIQILSETVSMAYLRNILEAVLFENQIAISECALVGRLDERSGHRLVLFCEKSQDEIIKQFNSRVKPYEKISEQIIIDQIPKTDLGKIIYNKLTN